MAAGEQLPGDDDAHLLRAYGEGDEEAFAQLFERHYDRVYRLAYRYAGSATDAEDLAQRVFLKVMQAASTFEPRARFTTWLFRVTANECLSYIRSRQRSLELTGVEGAAELQVSQTVDPAEEVLRDELAREVRAAVLALPERQRLAVVLSRYEGLSYAQIADALGVSVQAVKSLLNRAHTALREKLRRSIDGEESSET